MDQIWEFLRDEKNLNALKVIGAGCAAVVVALWTVYVWRKRESNKGLGDTSSHENADSVDMEIKRQSVGDNYKFWDGLSDKVFIIFGVSEPSGDSDGRWSGVSPRDIRAANEVSRFLIEQGKTVELSPANEHDWRSMIRDGGDLVLIGGFVSNQEFKRQCTLLSGHDNFRLKMGRLCGINGQRVYDVRFNNLPEDLRVSDPDNAYSPGRMDRIPSEYVSQDFAYIFSTTAQVYEKERRVIGVAGVKGHGTCGAATYLTQMHKNPVQSLLTIPHPLSSKDTLELALSVEVFENHINRTNLIEARLNDDIFYSVEDLNLSRSCQLGKKCKSCDFGETVAGNFGSFVNDPATLNSRDCEITSVIFDLDDTLVDTFSNLITPLEKKAAHAMIDAGCHVSDTAQLHSLLLQARLSNPGRLEEVLRSMIPGVTEGVLEARRSVFSEVPFEDLVVDPKVMKMLDDLSKRYQLFLVTEGDWKLQNNKIDHAQLKSKFKEILVVSSDTEESKEARISELLGRLNISPKSVLIIGNRLDKEILAGKNLGTKTAWIYHGEGSKSDPGKQGIYPDFSYENVLKIREMLLSK